jgi:hypothetical protein
MKGYPTRFVVFDTETNEHVSTGKPRTVDLRLRLGCAIVSDREEKEGRQRYDITFNTSAEFHAMLSDMPLSRTPIYVFAHNIGFDSRIVEFFRAVAMGDYSLLPPLSFAGAGRYKDPLFIADSPPFIVRLWRKDGQPLLLIDTYQWVPKALATIGEEIGQAKGTMPKAEATDHDWAEYCFRDCEVTLRMLERIWEFLQRERFSEFCVTPASQAMLAYKMRFERKRIIRPEDPDMLKLDRLGYYGGRIEAFYVGLHERLTYQLDVTSLYPFVMLGNPYPCGIETTYDDHAMQTPDQHFDPRVTTAEVYLESSDGEYPVRGIDETLWCTGKVRCVLCGPELERAWQSGHVVGIGRWTRYLMDDLFSDYVSWLWSRRDAAHRNGDKFVEGLCKSLLNSLHGKFGQRTGDWQHQGREHSRNTFATGRCIGQGIDTDTDFRVIAGHTYYRTREDEDPRGFVPIAAWCASYGRVYMAEARTLCGEGHVLYQATDSLLVDGEGLAGLQLSNMIHDHRLGTFRHEDTLEWVAIQGVNSLDTPRKRTRPGVPSKALQVASETYEIEAWQGFLEGIAEGSVSSVSISTISKHCRPNSSRRRLHGDGSTSPLTVNNWHLSPEEQRKIPARSTLAKGV